MSTPKIIGSAPILLVRDVVASAGYYRDHVGFEINGIWGEPPSFCILERDGYSVMLSAVENEGDIRPNYKAVKNMWNVYFWVDNVEAMYQEILKTNAKLEYELCDQPYGCREFGILDVDGYSIAFGQDLDTMCLRSDQR